jgi:ubiquitin fusion degradation protein 1
MFNMFQFGTGNVFESKYKVHSMAFKGGSQDMDDGGKILLPPSALDVLSRLQISWPVFFYVRNPALNRSTHCGVQEFTADEGTCNMPFWMMQQLGFKVSDGGSYDGFM